MQALQSARAPYHQWLGLKVIAVSDDGIEIKATWREEWVVNPERRYTHGGVLAALVDLARRLGDGAASTGRGVPTIDLRVDYHAAAHARRSHRKGKIVRMGGQFSTAEAPCSTRKASSSPAAAAPISPPRRHRRKPDARDFTNLGDLIRRDRDLSQDRDHRSRRRAGAARVQLCATSTR